MGFGIRPRLNMTLTECRYSKIRSTYPIELRVAFTDSDVVDIRDETTESAAEANAAVTVARRYPGPVPEEEATTAAAAAAARGGGGESKGAVDQEQYG